MLENVRYTIRDTRNRRDPADCVASIMINRKNSGVARTDNAQVLIAYKYIDSELRRDLALPTPTSTISIFLKELRTQKIV